MTEFTSLLQQGNVWLFVPSAILLGALHGLEPGHSKTMMASFIIAVKGSIAQAAMLGLCAAFSHSLIVWALAAAALRFGNELIAEQAEPYFMLLSAVIVIAVAIWMFMRTRKDERAAHAHRSAPNGGKLIDTGHGLVELEVFETGVPPRFRVHAYDQDLVPREFGHQDNLSVETIRPDGARQTYGLKASGGFFESVESIPEPHEFEAILSVRHGDHLHQFEVQFTEPEHGHAPGPNQHGHHHPETHADDSADAEGYQDAHERAHAQDIKRRFTGQKVTTGQIAMFGLTGGLVPCPASVTILVICLHLKRFTLGAVMVASFSVGLAISLVSVGVIAAWGAQHVGKRISKGRLSDWARKMPYFSSALMAFVAVIMGGQALIQVLPH